MTIDQETKDKITDNAALSLEIYFAEWPEASTDAYWDDEDGSFRVVMSYPKNGHSWGLGVKYDEQKMQEMFEQGGLSGVGAELAKIISLIAESAEKELRG